MMRSLYAGVSGLQNHQTRMDVIGNNISNVNTYGFKKGRATFQDMISQQINGAARPTEEVGGVFTIVFEEDGSVSFDTEAYEDDILYDEISSGLLVKEIKVQRQELLESLSLYYRVFVLHESVGDALDEEEKD